MEPLYSGHPRALSCPGLAIECPEYQLQFQPGDVLGFYVESHGDEDNSNYDNGVVVLNTNDHFSELVWFASVDITAVQPSQSGSCPYPVGTNGVLNSSTHAAPVISISMTTYACSPSSSTATITYLVHPTPTSSDNNAHDQLGLSTALITGASVTGLCVIVILVVITVAAMLYCVKLSRKATPSSSSGAKHEELDVQTEERYDYPDVISTEFGEKQTCVVKDFLEPSIKLKQNEAYAVVELQENQAYAEIMSARFNETQLYSVRDVLEPSIKLEEDEIYTVVDQLEEYQPSIVRDVLESPIKLEQNAAHTVVDKSIELKENEVYTGVKSSHIIEVRENQAYAVL